MGSKREKTFDQASCCYSQGREEGFIFWKHAVTDNRLMRGRNRRGLRNIDRHSDPTLSIRGLCLEMLVTDRCAVKMCRDERKRHQRSSRSPEGSIDGVAVRGEY